jgi:hypothetical protein
MSQRQPEENENLLRFIASTVEMIRDRLESTATKEDIERVVTKEEFEPVREQVEFLGGQVEDLRDRMATKSDLTRLEDRLVVESTAVRGDIEQVHLRIDGIDRALALRLGHVESEMSRMRSVLYLLVKDRPDMLRLLGQPGTPPGG